ncbi:MAG: DUF882 domain-containing protein [Gammaproteobacteria bacterium]|nr:DUF882 domain-containing protein [Gammaproteobacteria bacterium]
MTWKNFTRDEFACQCGCGTNEIKDELIDFAQELRNTLGFPLVVPSGYRCPNHPIEAKKATPGTHARGIAADFGVSGGKARLVTIAALGASVGGVGVNQKGSGRFVHVDVDSTRVGLFWTY